MSTDVSNSETPVRTENVATVPTSQPLHYLRLTQLDMVTTSFHVNSFDLGEFARRFQKCISVIFKVYIYIDRYTRIPRD